MGSNGDERRRHRRSRDRLIRHGIVLAIAVFMLTQGYHLLNAGLASYTMDMTDTRLRVLERKVQKLEYRNLVTPDSM